MQSRKASIECSFDELEEQLKQGKIKENYTSNKKDSARYNGVCIKVNE